MAAESTPNGGNPQYTAKDKAMSIKNVFETITSFETLLYAEKEVGSGKKGLKKDALIFREDLENNLFELRDSMLALSPPKAKYNLFYVYEPKVRKVVDIDYKNKIIQRAIYDVLNPLICKGYISDTYSCVEGRGQLNAMKCLYDWEQYVVRTGGEWWCFKGDVRRFFYRIVHTGLEKNIDKKIGDKRATALLKHYIFNQEIPFGLPLDGDPLTITEDEMLRDRGIPIGGGLSHMEGNMHLDPLDQYCKRVLGIKFYVRYMDDIIILSNSKEQLHEWKKRIEDFLFGMELQLNNKTAIMPINQGVEFVGYRIWPTHVTIRKSTSLRMKRRLKHTQEQYANYEITLFEASQTVSSYKALMKHCNCHNLDKKIFENFILTHDKEKLNAR